MGIRSSGKVAFLTRVLRHDRPVGLFFVAFALVQSGAQLFTAEVTPFFLYGMYSEVLEPQPTYIRVTCVVDDEPLVQTDMPRFAGELFFSTLDRYQRLATNGGRDIFRSFLDERFAWLPPEARGTIDERLSFRMDETPALMAWMDRYLERVMKMRIDHITIAEEEYAYRDGRPVLLRTRTLQSRKE